MPATVLTMPDDARLWIFVASTTIPSDKATALLDSVRDFLETWTSHGRPVSGVAELIDARILLVAGRLPSGADISGCGIDAMTVAVARAAEALDGAWLDGLHVVYRSWDGRLQALPRAAFRQEVSSGRVTAETAVIDTTVSTVGVLRQSGLERPAGESWHGRVFRFEREAATSR